MTHAAGEISVGRADTFQWCVHSTEGINWTAEASSTPGVFCHLNSCREQKLPQRAFSPTSRLQVTHDLRRGRHSEGINAHMFALEDARKFEKIACFSSCAGT